MSYYDAPGWPGGRPSEHYATDTPGDIPVPSTGPLVTQRSAYVEAPTDVLDRRDQMVLYSGLQQITGSNTYDVTETVGVNTPGPVAGAPDWSTRIAQTYGARAYETPTGAQITPSILGGV